jgi:hypothetical protein
MKSPSRALSLIETELEKSLRNQRIPHRERTCATSFRIYRSYCRHRHATEVTANSPII